MFEEDSGQFIPFPEMMLSHNKKLGDFENVMSPLRLVGVAKSELEPIIWWYPPVFSGQGSKRVVG